MSSFHLIKIGVLFENQIAGKLFSGALKEKTKGQNVLVINCNYENCSIDKSFDAVILDRNPLELEVETRSVPRLLEKIEGFGFNLKEINHIFYFCRHSMHTEPMLYQIQKGRRKFPLEKSVQKTAQATPTIPI
ncbi:MAG: hypothetical protein ACOCUF_02805 [Patescibacteria group bacterium]